jgi:2-haloacid dehalogenase
MEGYRNAMAFPDAHHLLSNLQVPWSILTNGDQGLIHPDMNLFTSDQVNLFKVNQHMYESTWLWAQKSGTPLKSDVIFVSANQWDAIAASWFGFTSCWINRANQSPEQLGARPTCEVTSLSKLATQMDFSS